MLLYCKGKASVHSSRMRLVVSVKANEHQDIVTAVSWSPDCQLLSCSDDKVILKWGADSASTGKITTLAAFPTSISWFPTIGKQVCINFVTKYYNISNIAT